MAANINNQQLQERAMKIALDVPVDGESFTGRMAERKHLADTIFRELVAVRNQQQRTNYAAARAKAFRDAADMVEAGSGRNNRRDIIRELQYVAKQALDEGCDD